MVNDDDDDDGLQIETVERGATDTLQIHNTVHVRENKHVSDIKLGDLYSDIMDKSEEAIPMS